MIGGDYICSVNALEIHRWIANIEAAMTIANEFKSRESVISLTKVRIGSSPIAHNTKKEWFTWKIGRGDIDGKVEIIYSYKS